MNIFYILAIALLILVGGRVLVINQINQEKKISTEPIGNHCGGYKFPDVYYNAEDNTCHIVQCEKERSFKEGKVTAK